jgi:putative ATP-dependent endonuclease of OLD family
MYLSALHIKNFRAVQDCVFKFNEGVNILIGGNNTGKSAVMDALRLCFTYGEPWRSIRIKEEDFFLNRATPSRPARTIEFDLTFKKSEGDAEGIFGDMLVLKEGVETEFQLHFRYNLVLQNGKLRPVLTMWGGEKEGHPVDYGMFAYFETVYLEALRDAVNNLKPSNVNRLGELYSSLVDETEQGSLTDEIHQSFQSPRWQEVIEEGRGNVTTHLNKSSINGKSDGLHIGFLPHEFREIVNGLRLQTLAYDPSKLTPADKQAYFSLHQNGLGSNNLIYTAAVLGDLEKKKQNHPDAFFSLLIEEPEAHLHPQLQNKFFDYLSSLNDIGVQLFITSHSPTITAKSPLDSLVVLQKLGHDVKSLSLSDSNLDVEDKKYLHKFLDVTKSQMLFAESVLFVEGISEALLLPEIAKIVGEKYNLVSNGVEIVNVSGVSFEHFAKLFNSTNGCLQTRAAILTDKDNQSGQLSPRAQNATNLEGAKLKVFLAEITFEYELFLAGNNENIILSIMDELHPIIAKEIRAIVVKDGKARRFAEALKDNDTKAEFSHRLSVKLFESATMRSGFSSPNYISNAIKWLIDGA